MIGAVVGCRVFCCGPSGESKQPFGGVKKRLSFGGKAVFGALKHRK